LAALLTSEMHSIDGVVKYIAECRRRGIHILPPDINRGEMIFTVKDTGIIFGLVAVKNVGEGAIEAILEERKKGPFTSLYEFCERVDLRRVNKRVIESLIKCGAFDSTGSHRAQMMAALESAMDHGQQVQREKNSPQMSLFDIGGTKPALNRPEMPPIEPWDEKHRLAFEKESLGFYISGHPLDRYDAVLEKFATDTTLSLAETKDRAAVRVGGVIREVKTIRTKKGDPMAFVTLEDRHGHVEVTVFTSVYDQALPLLIEDTPALIHGQVQKDENSIKLLADTIIRMEEAEAKWSAEVRFCLELDRTDKDLLVRLHQVLKSHPGTCRGFLHLKDADKTETIIALPDHLKVEAGKPLARAVNGLVGYNAYETVCKNTIRLENLNGNNGKFKKKS
jgi:DNA polymerase III subunit alpha